MPTGEEPNWQPISSLGLVGSVIDGQLESCRDQHRALLEATERPYVLDQAPVARVLRVFGDTAAGLWLYDTQLTRWGHEALTAAQHGEVERLQGQMAALHSIVDAVLALASRLQGQTIEALLAKSDAEVGLEWAPRTDWHEQACVGDVVDRPLDDEAPAPTSTARRWELLNDHHA